jgi:hypothetical protein
MQSERWRRFADGVALALGINVWMSIDILPGLFVGALKARSVLALAIMPLVVLAIGLWRRSETVLLLIFPSAVLAPVALAPPMASAYVYGPIRFTVVAVGLITYLLGVSFFTSFREMAPPVGVRPLASSRQATPERWKRRVRIYRGLVILSVILPATLLYWVNFDETNQAFIADMFPSRVAPMTTVINLAVIALWVLLYLRVFLGVLKPHRSGDRDLVTDLGRIREQARRGRPRALFYVGVVAALAFMATLLALRHL